MYQGVALDEIGTQGGSCVLLLLLCSVWPASACFFYALTSLWLLVHVCVIIFASIPTTTNELGVVVHGPLSVDDAAEAS